MTDLIPPTLSCSTCSCHPLTSNIDSLAYSDTVSLPSVMSSEAPSAIETAISDGNIPQAHPPSLLPRHSLDISTDSNSTILNGKTLQETNPPFINPTELSSTTFSITITRPSLGWALRDKLVSAVISEPSQQLNIHVGHDKWPFMFHSFTLLHPPNATNSVQVPAPYLAAKGVPLTVVRISIYIQDPPPAPPSVEPQLFATVLFPSVLLYPYVDESTASTGGTAPRKKQFVVAIHEEKTAGASDSNLSFCTSTGNGLVYENIINNFNKSIANAIGNHKVGKLYLIFSRPDKRFSGCIISSRISSPFRQVRPTGIPEGISNSSNINNSNRVDRQSSPAFSQYKRNTGKASIPEESILEEDIGGSVKSVGGAVLSKNNKHGDNSSKVNDENENNLFERRVDTEKDATTEADRASSEKMKDEIIEKLEERNNALKLQLDIERRHSKDMKNDWAQTKKLLTDELEKYKSAVNIFGGISALHASHNELSRLREQTRLVKAAPSNPRVAPHSVSGNNTNNNKSINNNNSNDYNDIINNDDNNNYNTKNNNIKEADKALFSRYEDKSVNDILKAQTDEIECLRLAMSGLQAKMRMMSSASIGGGAPSQIKSTQSALNGDGGSSGSCSNPPLPAYTDSSEVKQLQNDLNQKLKVISQQNQTIQEIERKIDEAIAKKQRLHDILQNNEHASLSSHLPISPQNSPNSTAATSTPGTGTVENHKTHILSFVKDALQPLQEARTYIAQSASNGALQYKTRNTPHNNSTIYNTTEHNTTIPSNTTVHDTTVPITTIHNATISNKPRYSSGIPAPVSPPFPVLPPIHHPFGRLPHPPFPFLVDGFSRPSNCNYMGCPPARISSNTAYPLLPAHHVLPMRPSNSAQRLSSHNQGPHNYFVPSYCPPIRKQTSNNMG